MSRTEQPETTLTMTAVEDSPKRVSVREWTLEVVQGPDKGKKAARLEGLIRVGSDPTNDLVLSDNTVSRRHFEVERSGRGLLLKDLGSRNGTFLDGRQVLQVHLEPGDKITLGKTKIAVKERSRGTEIELAGGESFGELVGSSQAIRQSFAELRRIARDDLNLLLEGETGTGKELAARAVHSHSIRRHSPFRVVDCALVSDNNADRELFGPEGAFAAADGGAVFFDEVAELPATVQPRLLRVIETRELPALGSRPAAPLNARILSATARNLSEEIDAGRFRKELYYRLAVTRVRLPPLRTHKDDIPLLARHLMRTLGTRIDLPAQTLSLLEGYDWPGNVRELRNVLERGALMQQTGNSGWLDFLAQAPNKQGDGRAIIDMVGQLPYHEAKDRVAADFERQYFAHVMKESGFDIKVAEARTGLSMQSLYRLLKKNGLRLKDLKNAEGLS